MLGTAAAVHAPSTVSRGLPPQLAGKSATVATVVPRVFSSHPVEDPACQPVSQISHPPSQPGASQSGSPQLTRKSTREAGVEWVGGHTCTHHCIHMHGTRHLVRQGLYTIGLDWETKPFVQFSPW